MSLTRKEWEEMWKSIKEIEKDAYALKSTNWLRGRSILEEVKFIKDKIQQVIGQME